jgi:flagellar motor switch protein FliM
MPDSKDVDSMSQDEINELLGSLGDVEPQELAGSDESGEGASVKILDLQRPEAFSENELTRLRAIASGWSDGIRTHLRDLAGAEVAVTVDTVDVLTYGEFLRSLPNPGCFVEFDTPKGLLMVELFPTLASVFLSLATGCGARPGDSGSSEISRRILAAFVDSVIVKALTDPTLEAPFSPTLRGVKSDPSLLSITDPHDMVVLCSLGVQFDELDASLSCNVCVPRFVAQASIRDRSARRENGVEPEGKRAVDPDIWLTGRIDFSFQHARGEVVSRALEQKHLEASGETAGQLCFWPEGSAKRD